MGKFVIKPAKNGGFHFNLLASNGQVIASSQVYKALQSCKQGIKSVQQNAPIAIIEDQTKENFESLTNPKFVLYQSDADQKYRFRMKAKNGQIVIYSQGYSSVKACQNGIAATRKNAEDSTVEILDE